MDLAGRGKILTGREGHPSPALCILNNITSQNPMAASACVVHSFWNLRVASKSRCLLTLSPSKSTTLSFPIAGRHSNRSTKVTFSSRLRAAKSDSVSSDKRKEEELEQEEEEEVVEELPWIQEKALDLVEFTGSVTQAIPGPRVGRSSFPWILALPLAYFGITFVFAFVKTVRKFTSPREKRRKLVHKNAMLCKSIDELFEKGKDKVEHATLKGLAQKACFDMENMFRKYIRYSLNEKLFSPDLIADLIQLRKASMLTDFEVAGILNEISRRIVQDKGPVVMDISGYSEKGLKRKLAVQALFGKIHYLSELPEFCSRDSSLTVKEIFGVADEEAEKLRLHTIPEAGNMDSLERMVNGPGSEDSGDELSDVS